MKTYEVNYHLDNNGVNIKSEKQWLRRHNYSKLVIKVFGELCKDLQDLSDAAIASRLKISRSSYQECKRQLVMCGLIEVHRLNASSILYLVGTKAITENNKQNQKREDDRIIRLTLESIGRVPEVLEDISEEVHTETTVDIKKPKPLNLNSEDIL